MKMCWLLRIDPMGELLSVNSYGGSGNEVGNGVAITKDGGSLLPVHLPEIYTC